MDIDLTPNPNYIVDASLIEIRAAVVADIERMQKLVENIDAALAEPVPDYPSNVYSLTEHRERKSGNSLYG